MSSSDHHTSLSPSERQRTKSQSSYRSYRTTPNLTVYDDDTQREKASSQTSRRSTTRDTARTKRSESSTSNRSANATSPVSNASKKQRPKSRSGTSPAARRKVNSRTKRRPISVDDIERRQLAEANDAENQDLSSQGISLIPAEIFQLDTLRRLILINNNLSSLPPSVGKLINLEYLDVSRNPLLVSNGYDDYSCFPRELLLLKNLRTLILAECSLKNIPAVVWNMIGLQRLDISRNKVGFIVGEIGNLIDLRHLRLSHMDLDTLPPEVGFCNKLETIDLTGNPIDNLPETLIECRNVYEFKINCKTFHKLLDFYMIQLIEEGKIRSEHIPQVLFELENLRVLDLDSTKINCIPADHILMNLSQLYLSRNSFFDIPEAISNIEQLKLLDLSRNRITTIPDHFVRLQKLEVLKLAYNRLTTVPKVFASLPSLRKLIISHNKIETLDVEFTKSRAVRILDLSYNELTHIPETLCDMDLLETLDLRYNKIALITSSVRRMSALKSMNVFNNIFERCGLHLIGNPITEPPPYIWRSTKIETLFYYIELKEKHLANRYYHLKLIFIGPKNVGKTTLVNRLVSNRNLTTNTRKSIDMYVTTLENQQSQRNSMNSSSKQLSSIQQTSKDPTSSALTDHWIENRVSTTGDPLYSHHLKTKRVYPPPLKTYRSTDTVNSIIQKVTLITKNNLHCTILDIKYEPIFEVLYPLFYDSNALYILPVNLTVILNNLRGSPSFENLNENGDEPMPIDIDGLLNDEWFNYHILHYLESISDSSEQVSIAIIGLIDNSQIESTNQKRSVQVLERIHSKVNAFLLKAANQQTNIRLYSEYFKQVIHIDNDRMLPFIVEQLEIIAKQWNNVHHKQKQRFVRQRFEFLKKDAIVINYTTCLSHFEKQKPFSVNTIDDEQNNNITHDNKQILEEELNAMSFNDCLDYLKLIGEFFCFGPKPQTRILLKPYYLCNRIFSNTLFRPHIEQWLNYEDNMIFRFSGYYPTQELFDNDRQRLLCRGEYTWKMLNVLFLEQNVCTVDLREQTIFDYCYLMERLYIGFLNQSNLSYREFTTACFICPWLMNERCSSIDYMNYFKTLEQERKYEHIKCEQSRRIKQQKLWFQIDHQQVPDSDNPLQMNMQDVMRSDLYREVALTIPELPSIDEVQVSNSQIIIQDSIRMAKIRNDDQKSLPNGLYERLLICLHPLFHERLDYYNFTLGRTIDKSLIKIERFDDEKEIFLTISNGLLERIQNLVTQNLFSFYSTKTLRIQT